MTTNILFEALKEILDFGIAGILEGEDAQQMVDIANIAIANYDKEQDQIEAVKTLRNQVLSDARKLAIDKILCLTCKADCSFAGKNNTICCLKSCKFYEKDE